MPASQPTAQLTDDNIRTALRVALTQASDVYQRATRGELFPDSAPSSRNTEDDELTQPYSFTHGVQALLVSTAEHLGAITELTTDIDALPASPFFTLARTALESACTAYWLISPPDRRQRVLRHVRHEAQDRFDASEVVAAMRAAETSAEGDDDIKKRQRYESALKLQLGFKSVGKFKIDEVLREVDHALGPKGENRDSRRILWKVASGFAHGRPWARRYVFKRGEIRRVSADVLRVSFENTPDRALWALSGALEVLDATLRLYARAATG